MINTFQIYPEHCNPLMVQGKQGVHGGQLLLIADRNAALVVKNLLDPINLVGLTVGVDKCQFHRFAACGEILKVESILKSLGKSRITIEVKITDQTLNLVFEGLFSFCSFYETEEGTYTLATHCLEKV